MSEEVKSDYGKKMLEAQKQIGAVKRTSDNPHYRSTYADLNEVMATVKPILNKHGLRIIHKSGQDQFGKYVDTLIVDVTGTGEATRKYFSGTEENMQKLGAASTYARRFGLSELLALETEDDDGETAVGRGRAPAKPAFTPPKPAAPVVKAQQVIPETTVESAQTAPAIVATAQNGPVVPPFDRALVLKTAKQYCKVAVDKKQKTKEEVQGMVQYYGAAKTDELTDEHLVSFLNEIKAVVNG